jgi:hypothetical protein
MTLKLLYGAALECNTVTAVQIERVMSAKKWFLVGAGIGAGALTIVSVIIGLMTLYSLRPKPWDQASLKARSKVVWMYSLYPDLSAIKNVSLSYVIQNTTNRDIVLSTPLTIMMSPERGEVDELSANLYQVDFPSFIPAQMSVEVTLDAPNWFTTSGRGNGFVLYDRVNHYQINLPEPTGPTEADRKMNLK